VETKAQEIWALKVFEAGSRNIAAVDIVAAAGRHLVAGEQEDQLMSIPFTRCNGGQAVSP
jgi:hypothetical protein